MTGVQTCALPICKDNTQGVGSADVVVDSIKEESEKTSIVSIDNATPSATRIVIQVKTQAGRLVRPVNRLIQNMTQRQHTVQPEILLSLCHRGRINRSMILPLV